MHRRRVHNSPTRRSTKQRRTPLYSCDPTTPTGRPMTPRSIRDTQRNVDPNKNNSARYAGILVHDSVPFNLNDDLDIKYNEHIFYCNRPTSAKTNTRCEEGFCMRGMKL